MQKGLPCTILLAMDGIAVHSQSTENASEKSGYFVSKRFSICKYWKSFLPEDFDSVIKIEDVIPVKDE